MRFQLEITEKKEIKIWDTDNPNELNAPFLNQSSWPDGTEWLNKEEAQAWADLFIESLENPQSEFVAGNSPNEPKRLRPKPTEEEK